MNNQLNSNNEEQGQEILSAVERLLASDEDIIKQVEAICKANPIGSDEDDKHYLNRIGEELISFYSLKSAISGGATALPAIIPGAGTLVAVLGGTLADVALTLKFEIEMSLAIAHLYHFDISNEEERKKAFLLASVSTYEAKSGQNLIKDILNAEMTAIWNYAPREVSKLLILTVGRLGLAAVSKSFAKAVPFIGITIGAATNKVLTGKVGKQCLEAVQKRQVSIFQDGEIIDATYDED